MAVLNEAIISDFTTGMLVIGIAATLHLLLFLAGLVSVLRSSKGGLVRVNWIVFQFLFVVIGPIIYFIIGRERQQNNFDFKMQDSSLSKPSRELESVFKTDGASMAKSVTTSSQEDTQETTHMGTGSIFEQGGQIEINERVGQAVDYVRTNIAKGFQIEKIKDALRKSGWREEDITNAVLAAQKK